MVRIISWVVFSVGLLLAGLCVLDMTQKGDKSGLLAYFLWVPAIVCFIIGAVGVYFTKP